MKIFTKKSILKKLVLVLIIVIAFNAVIPTNVSYAADPGGVLLKPILDLMIFFADAAMDIVHNVLFGMETSVLKIDKDLPIWEILGIVVGVIVAVALIVAVSGAVLAAGAGIVAALGGAASFGAAFTSAISVPTIIAIAGAALQGGFAAGMFVRSQWFSDEYVLPMYRITPEEIFSGNVRLLNVNFFRAPEHTDEDIDTYTNIQNATVEKGPVTYASGAGATAESVSQEINAAMDSLGYTGEDISAAADIVRRWSYNNGAYEMNLDVETSPEAGYTYTHWTYTISKGEWVGSETNTLGMELRPTITKWYYAIRNFALVIMMIILLYIGIRIMLTGISSEKAKYKNMLMDWVVAICLIFVMHYIMAFAMNIVDEIIEIFGSVNETQQYVIDLEYNQKIINDLNDLGINTSDIIITPEDGDGEKYILWDAKNIVGLARVQAALTNSGTTLYIGWAMCYVVLVIYTLFFIYTYLRRALYLAFFTIISPLVAMTYPLDKMHDGKAQAFDMWLKEYIFNLMIQPVHLLLYTVLISSAFQLATTNIVYMLTAIGFIMPAEKFVRKMFGFGKAETPGVLDGAAGSALILSGFNKLLNRKNTKGGKGHKSGDKSSDDDGYEKFNKLGDDNLYVTSHLGPGNPPANPGSNANGGLVRNTQRAIPSSSARARHNIAQRRRTAINQNTIPIRRMPSARTRTNSGGGNIPVRVRASSSGGQNPVRVRASSSGGQNPVRVRANSSGGQNPVGGNTMVLPNGRRVILPPSPPPKGFLHKTRDGALSLTRGIAKQSGENLNEYLSSGGLIEDATNFARGAEEALFGATVGTLGMIASGEGLKKSEYVATAAAAGYMHGSRGSESDLDEKQLEEDLERAKYNSDEEYQAAKAEQKIDERIDNEKNLRRVRDYMGFTSIDEAKTFMQDNRAFLKGGFTDMKEFCTVSKLKQDMNCDEKLAASIMKTFKIHGKKPSSLGEEDRHDLEYRLRKMAEAEGITNTTQIDQCVTGMLEDLERCGKINDGFSRLR